LAGNVICFEDANHHPERRRKKVEDVKGVRENQHMEIPGKRNVANLLSHQRWDREMKTSLFLALAYIFSD
jgi:hypothetical protein